MFSTPVHNSSSLIYCHIPASGTLIDHFEFGTEDVHTKCDPCCVYFGLFVAVIHFIILSDTKVSITLNPVYSPGLISTSSFGCDDEVYVFLGRLGRSTCNATPPTTTRISLLCRHNNIIMPRVYPERVAMRFCGDLVPIRVHSVQGQYMHEGPKQRCPDGYDLTFSSYLRSYTN